jgi:hypothetical protein
VEERRIIQCSSISHCEYCSQTLSSFLSLLLTQHLEHHSRPTVGHKTNNVNSNQQLKLHMQNNSKYLAKYLVNDYRGATSVHIITLPMDTYTRTVPLPLHCMFALSQAYTYTYPAVTPAPTPTPPRAHSVHAVSLIGHYA